MVKWITPWPSKAFNTDLKKKRGLGRFLFASWVGSFKNRQHFGCTPKDDPSPFPDLSFSNYMRRWNLVRNNRCHREIITSFMFSPTIPRLFELDQLRLATRIDQRFSSRSPQISELKPGFHKTSLRGRILGFLAQRRAFPSFLSPMVPHALKLLALDI